MYRPVFLQALNLLDTLLPSAKTGPDRTLVSSPHARTHAQARPDNYTDASFLEALVVNAGVERQRRYWPIVLGACAVSQQISTVAAASLAVPAHLRRGSLTVGALLAADAALLASGYLLCALLGGHLLGGSIRRGLRQCALLVGRPAVFRSSCCLVPRGKARACTSGILRAAPGGS